jgi:hypothetical protein
LRGGAGSFKATRTDKMICLADVVQHLVSSLGCTTRCSKVNLL